MGANVRYGSKPDPPIRCGRATRAASARTPTSALFLDSSETEELTMNHIATNRTHTPWNKGKLVGSKPPLRTKDVWSIRTKLQVSDRARDLAMFNLAIDSKLRGCDVVSLKVEDVA